MQGMTSSEVCASSITALLVKLLAKAFGVDTKTVEAWRRPKSTEANPWGTGKANPLDQAERAIRIIHPYDPAGARRWVQFLHDTIEQLERERAGSGFNSSEERCDAIARLVKEHAEAVVALMHNDDDDAALRELEEMLAVGQELAAALRAEIA